MGGGLTADEAAQAEALVQCNTNINGGLDYCVPVFPSNCFSIALFYHYNIRYVAVPY